MIPWKSEPAALVKSGILRRNGAPDVNKTCEIKTDGVISRCFKNTPDDMAWAGLST